MSPSAKRKAVQKKKCVETSETVEVCVVPLLLYRPECATNVRAFACIIGSGKTSKNGKGQNKTKQV